MDRGAPAQQVRAILVDPDASDQTWLAVVKEVTAELNLELSIAAGSREQAVELASPVGAAPPPELILLGPHLETPLATARRVHRVAPFAHLIFLVDAVRAAELRQALFSFAAIGSDWSIADLDGGELRAWLAKTIQAVRQRRRLRTTLDRINVRFAHRPAPAPKNLEAALAESQQLLRAIVDNSCAVIYVKDLEGRYLLINRRFEELFHVTRLSVAGKTDHDVFPAEQAEAFRANDSEVLAAGRALESEETVTQDDGLHTYLSVKAPIYDIHGLPYAICGISTDITERRHMEVEQQARRAAEAANEAKTKFLASMSHELRSPLNTILGFAQVLARHPELPEEAREDARLIIRSGEHLHALITDVLDMAKLDAGCATLNEAEFNLDILLDELKDTLAPEASRKGLQLIFVPRSGVPRYIHSDPLKLRQILINLIGNGIKFTCRGSVSVQVDAQWPTVAGDRCRIAFTVTDTGCGIAPGEMSYLFSPFVQTRAGREMREGTGLGLAISRGFVRLMGGDMQIDSKEGRGTTVRFDFPVQPFESLPIAEEVRSRQVLGLAPDQPRYRMLAVDDHAEARRLLVRLLTPLGFEVREAANGEEAMDLWRQWQPALIWMDLHMPILDGRAATRRIRAEQAGKEPVIVALTACGFEEEREDVLAAGCDDMLRKPFRESDLFAVLEKYLAVRFVYQEDAPKPRPPRPAPVAGSLPSALRARLEQAIAYLDPGAIDLEIEAIRTVDPPFAQALAAYARNFQYDEILAAIREAADS